MSFIAKEDEVNFYCHFDVAPLGMLSDCQYHNEFHLGVSYGDDVCEHTDDEYDCKQCLKNEEKYLYYPPITDDLLVNFLLICGIDSGLATKHYYTFQDKYDILCYVKAKADKDTKVKQEIRQLLLGQCQEYGRM